MITGRGAAEKQEIVRRLGAVQRVAEASRKKLTRDTVLQMRERGRFPIETWRALGRALDRLEEKEKNVSDSDTAS